MTAKFERDRRIEIEREIELGRWQRRAEHAEELIQRLFKEIAQLRSQLQAKASDSTGVCKRKEWVKQDASNIW
jgi:hypothetical protein